MCSSLLTTADGEDKTDSFIIGHWSSVEDRPAPVLSLDYQSCFSSKRRRPPTPTFPFEGVCAPSFQQRKGGRRVDVWLIWPVLCWPQRIQSKPWKWQSSLWEACVVWNEPSKISYLVFQDNSTWLEKGFTKQSCRILPRRDLERERKCFPGGARLPRGDDSSGEKSQVHVC